MNYKTVKLDGKLISRPDLGIYTADVDWLKLITSSKSINFDYRIGRIVSNSFPRYRVITIAGFLNLKNPNYQQGLNYLNQLFRLPTNFALAERILQLQDYIGNRWHINVKVSQPLERSYDDGWQDGYWKRRVVLESTYSPILKSIQQKAVSGGETILGGFNLGLQLPSAFDSLANLFVCQTSGNIPTPALIKINVKSQLSNLTIKNLNTGESFRLNITATSGDTIEIDSDKQDVLLNGASILANREPGSVWPFVEMETKFAIWDDDGGVIGQDFDCIIYFYDQLL